MDGEDREEDEGELLCVLDSVQGLVDALSIVKWKKQQDALVELSVPGINIIVEEWGCFQARVYFKRDLFRLYEYTGTIMARFGISLALLIDCLNTFTLASGMSALEIRYPGPDMQLMLRLLDTRQSCLYAELRTRIPDTIPWDCNTESTAGIPASFAVKSAALKEAIEDLEWPGSSIQLTINPDPPVVTFQGEGHGEMQIEFFYNAESDLFHSFNCNHQVSFRYKYKFLHATIANIPSAVLKDNKGSKVSIGNNGLLRIQHLVSVRLTPTQIQLSDTDGNIQPRHSYIEFFLKPEEDDDTHDS